MKILTTPNQLKRSAITLIFVVCLLGGVVIAQTSPRFFSFEAEQGAALTSATVLGDTNASGGSYVAFNTTTTPPPNPPPAGAQFFEDFTGDTSIDTLDYGVWYRDPYLVEMSNWPGDHADLGHGDCGAPTTARTVHRGITNEQIYLCQTIGDDPGKAHLMTAIGDTSGYTIAYFSPKKVFDNVSSVSFKVNLTNLGDRKWWKVGVVSDSTYRSTWNGSCCGPAPGFLFADAGAAGLPGLDGPDRLIGTWGENCTENCDGRLFGIGSDHFQGGQTSTPKEDKATRFPVNLVDNKNGTVTFTVAGESTTHIGSFPSCPCRVVFYDHSYTPNKSFWPRVENPYTWHWDDIQVN